MGEARLEVFLNIAMSIQDTSISLLKVCVADTMSCILSKLTPQQCPNLEQKVLSALMIIYNNFLIEDIDVMRVSLKQ